MKTRNIASFVLALGLAIVFVSCKKEKDEPKTPTGTLLNYTSMKTTVFDRIDILVDGKVAGSITKPYGIVKPKCGAANSDYAAAIVLPVGTHKVSALQFKDGKQVDKWSERTETITADQCTPANWVD
ncbi:hypothetical protein [Paraflavitalea pollutisoli]|uniref:hypothetical protein n=1 Tax=Paraflavitalea pollutisoli TaxID=3034143 RepID=UPI0023ECDAAA|nr:hypothetical protein [Paraflavitalea sp. H1-2-19X]